MFRLAALAERAAADAAERAALSDIRAHFQLVRNFHEHRMANLPKNQKDIAKRTHEALIDSMRSDVTQRIFDSRASARSAFRADWRRRHLWKLALLRVRGYLACVHLLSSLYEPGNAGFFRAAESFASAKTEARLGTSIPTGRHHAASRF